MITLLALSWSKIQVSHRWCWVVVQSTGDPAKRITAELFCLHQNQLSHTLTHPVHACIHLAPRVAHWESQKAVCYAPLWVMFVFTQKKKKKTWQNFVFEKWAMFPHVGRATELDEDAQKTDNCFCVIILVTQWPHHNKLTNLTLVITPKW